MKIVNASSVNSLLSASAMAFALGVWGADAFALALIPAGALATSDTNANCTTIECIDTAFGTNLSPTSDGYVLELLYKSNAEGGAEDGTFVNSYSTTFGQFEEPEGADTKTSDPSAATIIYDGASDPVIGCPYCYLVVKDGNHNPDQYLFNINTWNGTDTISLTDFWVGPGAISNVAIWGYKKPPTNGGDGPQGAPEPGVLFLMGAGLLGLGLARRRKSA